MFIGRKATTNEQLNLLSEYSGWISRAWASSARDREIGSRLKQTKELKTDTCRFLDWCLAYLWWGNDYLPHCQDNMTAWDIRVWCLRINESGSQHYNLTIATSRYLSWYYMRCCPDINLQQPSKPSCLLGCVWNPYWVKIMTSKTQLMLHHLLLT